MSDDELIFADELEAEEESAVKQVEKKNWKVLIVDDEDEVHKVTKFVLKNFNFMDRGLEFYSAYSAKEARAFMQQHPDFAIVLLDVVMEEDDAGLKLVKFIRKDIHNFITRIVLRTGQPGSAPEEKVIIDYDINDYKSKTELTVQRLFTTIVSSLRSYNDIVRIKQNTEGLKTIVDSSSKIFEYQNLKKFAANVLDELQVLLRIYHHNHYEADGFIVNQDESELMIVSGIGKYTQFEDQKLENLDEKQIVKDIKRVLKNRKSEVGNHHIIQYFQTNLGQINILFYQNEHADNQDIEENLINIFATNVAIAYDNHYLTKEIESTQREIIYRIGEMIDLRSHETGGHIKRVAEYCKFIGLQLGMDEEEANILKLASTMHDVGKVGIPDQILNKPGRLENEERNIMEKHSHYGFQMLNGSQRKIIQAAAIIAGQHHEKYNGTGYPKKLKGDEIHLYARIASVADVFDALN
ncbi:MAG: DUF3369 domain-containing protein, partial [Spirochaetes bacterium]|nr:DUF3369 domain-containing protein [Spirochaetota bacterium]